MKSDKKRTIDPGSSLSPVKRRGVTLKSETDVRRYLMKLIKAHLDGQMSADSLRASTYALNSVLAVFAKEPKGRLGVLPLGNVAEGGNDDELEPDDKDD